MKHLLWVTLFCVLAAAFALGQHGTPEPDSVPPGYSGDTFTGVVTATNDATREITLTYTKGKKTETFVGTLQPGYKVKLQDGSLHEIKPSDFRNGMRLKVYYTTQNKKVNGQKVKVYEIFQLKFMPNES
jgi:hypothetical protein